VSLTVSTAAAADLIPGISLTLRAGVEAASEYAKSKDADSTQQGYAADFRLFTARCEANGLPSLSATIPSVATYIAIEAQRGIRPATIDRRLVAIRYTHIAIRRGLRDREPRRHQPAAAPAEWIAAAGITSGPLFRSINKAGRVSAEGLSGRTVAKPGEAIRRSGGVECRGFQRAQPDPSWISGW
jgi:hypothetical protein